MQQKHLMHDARDGFEDWTWKNEVMYKYVSLDRNGNAIDEYGNTIEEPGNQSNNNNNNNNVSSF